MDGKFDVYTFKNKYIYTFMYINIIYVNLERELDILIKPNTLQNNRIKGINIFDASKMPNNFCYPITILDFSLLLLI